MKRAMIDASTTEDIATPQLATANGIEGPTVDVVIPCYNYARYLRGCVESVLSQCDVNVRILVIDDTSPDNTMEVGHALSEQYSQVEFRRHPVNKGHIATYNEGLIDWSRSKYTMLLSADDMLAPGSLSRAVRIMEADSSVGMVYGRTIHFCTEDELPPHIIRSRGKILYEGREWLRKRCGAGYNVITSPEAVVRGSVQRAVGGYRPELPHSGDLEMWLRIAAVSNIAYVRGAPQAFYRVHAASMQRTQFQGSLVDLVERKAAFESFFDRHPGEIADRESLREMARRALAREALWDACRLYDHNRVKQDHIEALVDFAKSVYDNASSLPEFAALKRRKRLGGAFCHRTQVFIAPAAIRWVGRWWRKRRWHSCGV